jgi:hypothetical protein
VSYARFGSDLSDVYVYMHASGHLECCGCRLGDDCFRAGGTRQMVDHLAAHAAAGHTVPGTVVADLWADDSLNFPPSGGGPVGTLDRRG